MKLRFLVIALVLILLCDSSLCSIQLKDESKHTLCNKSLLAHKDTLEFTFQFNNTNRLNPMIYMSAEAADLTRKLCSVKIPGECDQLDEIGCTCMSRNRSDIYDIKIRINADPALSKSLVRGELSAKNSRTYTDTIQCPKIYDPDKHDVDIEINNIKLDLKNCSLKINGTQAAIVFRRTEDTPSPCNLHILDASSNTLLQSHVDYISKNITIEGKIELNFTYKFCNSETMDKIVSCSIESEVKTQVKTSVWIIFCSIAAVILSVVLLILLYKILSSKKSKVFKKRFFSKGEHKDVFEPTSITNFNKRKLPEEFQYDDIEDYIKTVGKLTVKIHQVAERQTDTDRLLGDTTWTGTGKVISAKKYPENSKSSDAHPERCGEIKISTARCMKGEDTDVNRTTCTFFYDESPNNDAVELLVSSTGLENDNHILTCYSDDTNLLEKLENLLKHTDTLENEIHGRYKRKTSKSKIAILISHPNGGTKMVSVEKWKKEKKSTPKSRNESNHDTSACTGSCGAPKIVLGDKHNRCYIKKTSHKGKPKEGSTENISNV
ncbi:hypothetical protein Btru_071663 [Bulinus truncatus]|nr:hypothetical protein Btru_071663 [Bulinus truncatus]